VLFTAYCIRVIQTTYVEIFCSIIFFTAVFVIFSSLMSVSALFVLVYFFSLILPRWQRCNCRFFNAVFVSNSPLSFEVAPIYFATTFYYFLKTIFTHTHTHLQHYLRHGGYPRILHQMPACCMFSLSRHSPPPIYPRLGPTHSAGSKCIDIKSDFSL